MINSEAYNKFLNTKDNIDTDSYLMYLKQDNLDLKSPFLNFYSEHINNWSSKNHDNESWLSILREIEGRKLLAKLSKPR